MPGVFSICGKKCKRQDIWKSKGVNRLVNINALFFLGAIVGALAGFGLVWWLTWRNPSPEPFFTRLLRVEMHSLRLSRRLALHELQRRVEELSRQVERINLEIQDLQRKAAGEEGSCCYKEDSLTAWEGAGAPGSTAREDGLPPESDPLKGLDSCREIYRLFQEGLSPADIANKLRLGQGEVELVLSLGKRPSWVVGAKKN
jgi:hypothetical protein